jgi:hypothetical protein
VLDHVNDRRWRRRRCSLYSVGPSCGSASKLVTMMSGPSLMGSSPVGCSEGDDPQRPGGLGVDVLGVDQGDDTLGGSGSNVKTDAI